MDDSVKKILIAIVISLISLIVLIGGNVQDFQDVISTAISGYDTVPTTPQNTSVPTEAIPLPERTPTQEIGTIPTTTPTIQTFVQLKTTFAYGYANIRAFPSASANIIGKFYPGEKRSLLDNTGDWYKIPLANGKTGWIAAWVCELITQSAPSH